MSPRRSTLAGRISVAAIVVALVAVTTAGAVSMSLMQTVSQNESRRSLQKQADIVAALITELGPDAKSQRTLEILRSARTPAGILGRGGQVRGHRWARGAVRGWEDELAAGEKVSVKTEYDGRTFLVEARPLGTGAKGRGVVLTRVAAEITILAPTMLRQQSIALLLGLAAAVAVGLIAARTIASPLTRAASAATGMAAGDRETRVRPDGPREVADVAHALNTLVGALATSEGRQREFLMSISHELRTPLTAIKGYAESLADGVTEDQAGAGRTILEESTRLERLIADLLDLARLRAEEFRLDLAEVDLTEIMRDAATVWAARCEAVGVRWHAELPGAPARVVTDAARVRQIVDGLIENALRVTPRGRPIVLAVRPMDGGPVLEVRDGGPGLTAEDRAVAFERSVLYQRYRGVRKVGTGLGLALVHGLAVRLGGSAEVDVAPEGGALFRVRLPPGF